GRRGCIIHRRLKRAIAVAQNNGYTLAIPGRNVQFAVIVEVGCDNRLRTASDRVKSLWLESPVAIAQQQADRIPGDGGNHDIQITVAIEVAQGQAAVTTRVVVHMRLKRSVAVAQQNAYRLEVNVCRDYIQLAVVVEVSRDQRKGASSHLRIEGFLK